MRAGQYFHNNFLRVDCIKDVPSLVFLAWLILLAFNLVDPP